MPINSRRNNIWSNTLLEDDLCDTITKLAPSTESARSDGELSDEDDDRGVESYNFKADLKKTTINTSKNQLTHQLIMEGIKADRLNDNSNVAAKVPVKDRIGSLVPFDEGKERRHIKATEFDTDMVVTKEITRLLREDKGEVIARCVKVLGRKKSLELLYATEDIQQNGGMPTSDNLRRRTPGGVYFQLLKRDDSILNCQRKEIFIEEPEAKKKNKARKRLQSKNKKAALPVHARLSNQKKNTQDDGKDDPMDNIDENEMIYFGEENQE